LQKINKNKNRQDYKMNSNSTEHQPTAHPRPQSLPRSYGIHVASGAAHSNGIQVTPPSPTLSSRTVAIDKAYELKTYPQAWVALLLLVFLRAGSAVFQYTFAPIPAVTAEYFGVSLSAINWLSNIQGLVYVFLSFFTGWIFEKLGVKKSVLIPIASTWSSKLLITDLFI
jgi:hypothetical protein